MSEADFGVSLLVVLAVASSLYFHYRDSFFVRAGAKAALASTVAWATIVFGLLGHRDSLMLVALFFLFFWSFLIAVCVGFPVWLYRKYSAEEASRSLPDARNNNRDA